VAKPNPVPKSSDHRQWHRPPADEGKLRGLSGTTDRWDLANGLLTAPDVEYDADEVKAMM
jgi:hypothetical protein